MRPGTWEQRESNILTSVKAEKALFRGFKGSHGMWSRNDLPEKPTFSEEGYFFCVDVTTHGMLHRGLSTHDIMQDKSMRETASFLNCGLLYIKHSRGNKGIRDQWVQRIRHGKVLTTSVTLDLKRIIMSSFNYFYFKTLFPFLLNAGQMWLNDFVTIAASLHTELIDSKTFQEYKGNNFSHSVSDVHATCLRVTGTMASFTACARLGMGRCIMGSRQARTVERRYFRETSHKPRQQAVALKPSDMGHVWAL